MRKTETIDRRAFDLMLDHLDGDIQAALQATLIEWAGGDTCEQIEVSVDSTGRLDSESSPRPGGHSEPFTFIEPGGYKETTFAEAHRTGRPAIEIAQERVDRSAARTARETDDVPEPSGHSSGLWSKSGHGEEIIIDCGDIYGAATLPVHDPEFPAGEQHANARLMVAAPALLEACRVASRSEHHPACPIATGKGQTTYTHDDCTCHVKVARTAIAQTKGAGE